MGWVNVRNLLPNQLYENVLTPTELKRDIPVDRQRTVRVYSRERARVGGISVKVISGYPSSLIIYIYIISNNLCLLVCCQIITYEQLYRFASNFDGATQDDHGNVLSLVLRF